MNTGWLIGLIPVWSANWAVYSAMGHRTIRRLGPARATTGAMLLGGLVLLPLFVGAGAAGELARLSPRGVAALVFLGIACSGLGYLSWYAALERIEASRVAALLYAEPLVTLAGGGPARRAGRARHGRGPRPRGRRGRAGAGASAGAAG